MSKDFDAELADLPPELRWRQWMARIEAALFSSATPLGPDALAPLVGKDCVLADLIEDIRIELVPRPYDIHRMAGGWQFRSRASVSDALRILHTGQDKTQRLNRNDMLVLTVVAYLQPITRRSISSTIGREVSHDTVARLQQQGLLAHGPRSPEPGAPYSYVTTEAFLETFGLHSLRDLPEWDAILESGYAKTSQPD